MDASDLDEVFVGDGVEFFFFVHQFWKFDVNGGSESGSEVGWA